jgi:hypothetical protein
MLSIRWCRIALPWMEGMMMMHFVRLVAYNAWICWEGGRSMRFIVHDVRCERDIERPEEGKEEREEEEMVTLDWEDRV